MVASRLQTAGVPGGLHFLRGDVLEVGFTLVDGPDLFLIQLEAGHPEARLGELQRQGQPHVAQAHDTDARLAGVDPFAQFFEPSHWLPSSVCGSGARAAASALK